MTMGTFNRSGGFGKRQPQQGYVLLTLLLVVAVLVIAAAAVAPSIAFQIKRDREEELVHRGVQYSRAIRRYAKATGRFPFRLEDLQQANGMRFIRKLYKDPITGKDFKLIHTADIRTAGQLANPTPAAPQPDTQSVATPDSAGAPTPSENPADSSSQPNGKPTVKPAPADATPAESAAHDDGTGGAIFGVVSASKAKTIREYNHKNHYNEWLFFYDPSYDRGLEIKGPTSLTLPAAVPPTQPAGPAQITPPPPQQ